MQKILFPMKYMNITQGVGVGTHKGTFAIDNAGKDRGRDNAYAPFTGVIKKIWNNGNTVWLESTSAVQFADGTIDYAVCSMTHDDNVLDLRVGQVVNQGEVFYQEGTAGNATGNHIHIEIGRGKFTGTGWYKNSFGIWTINNKYLPYKAFYLSGTIVINNGGYAWKRITGGGMLSRADITGEYQVNRGKNPSEAEIKLHQNNGTWKSMSLGFKSENDSQRKAYVAVKNSLVVCKKEVTALTSTVLSKNATIDELRGINNALVVELADVTEERDATYIELTDCQTELEHTKEELEKCQDSKDCIPPQTIRERIACAIKCLLGK